MLRGFNVYSKKKIIIVLTYKVGGDEGEFFSVPIEEDFSHSFPFVRYNANRKGEDFLKSLIGKNTKNVPFK